MKFLKGFRVLKLPIIDENGRSAWPERFSLSKINTLKQRIGPHAFATQMMLERPDQKEETFFNTELIDFYTESLKYKEANRRVSLSWGNTTYIGNCLLGSSLGQSQS